MASWFRHYEFPQTGKWNEINGMKYEMEFSVEEAKVWNWNDARREINHFDAGKTKRKRLVS